MEIHKPVKVSIVTAAYNAEDFIQQMIMSVVNQPVEVELIIVNDGSKDDTRKICEREAFNSTGIVLINSDNQGAGAARNKGIKAATGDYIMFLDSDDLLVKDSINQGFINSLSEYKKNNVDIIYTGRYMVDMELLEEPVFTAPEKVKYNMPELEFWTCIYRREFLEKETINFYTFREQDIESAFRFLSFAKAKKIEYNSELSFYIHRINMNSNVHTFDFTKVGYVKAKIYQDLLSNQNLVKPSSKEAFIMRTIILDSIYKFVRSYMCLVDKTQKVTERYEELKFIFKDITKGSLHNIRCWDLKHTLGIIKKILFITVVCTLGINCRKDRSISTISAEEKINFKEIDFENNWIRVSNECKLQ